MIPSVALYSWASVHRIRVEGLSTQKKKLENVYKQQERPLFDAYDTLKLFKIDLQLPRYVLDEILNLEQLVKINPTCKNVKEMCLKEEGRINNVLQDLYKEGKIDEKTLKELKSTGDQGSDFIRCNITLYKCSRKRSNSGGS